MEKPRILIIENSIDVTGALKSITRTAFDLKAYFDFLFITPLGSRTQSCIKEIGFTVIHELNMKEVSRKFSHLVLYIPLLIFNTFRLRSIIKKEKIDLIHVNDLYNLLPPLLCMLGPKVPYLCHVRFMPDRFPKWLLTFWLKLHFKYASKIIAVSQPVLDLLPMNQKLVLIHGELPVEEHYPERMQTNANSFTFLYLSNIMAGKGQDYALRAFSKVHNQLTDWKLRIIGGDMGVGKNRRFLNDMKTLAKALGLENKVEWQGFTEDVEREYKQADITLNFSESESFSMVCLESLFFGIPVIATDSGGPVGIIDHEKTGLLVENRNIESMAKAMLRLAINKNERLEMGKQARKVVRHKFSIENTSYKLKEVYDSLMK